jgi:hypothetical protein
MFALIFDCWDGRLMFRGHRVYNQAVRSPTMKFRFRKPSLKKRFAARTSLKRVVRNRVGLKAPRGWGWFTNPKKAAKNRVYNRTSKGCLILAAPLLIGAGWLVYSLGRLILG